MGIACALHHRHLFRDVEGEAVGGANGDTGGFQTLVDSIHAVIALDNFSHFRIPLRGSPGTGGDTCFTSHTEIVVNENNTVLFAALHGTGRARRDTPWIFTVKTGHKNEGRPGFAVKEFGPHLDDLAGPSLRRK
jgi:hypothetical protein